MNGEDYELRYQEVWEMRDVIPLRGDWGCGSDEMRLATKIGETT